MADRKPLTELFEEHLLYELNRSRLTVEAYLCDISQFATFLSGSLQNVEDSGQAVASATTADIRLWLGSLANDGGLPRTIRRKTQSLRTFYRFLLKRGITKSNPATDIILAKTDKPLPQFVREEEMERIVSRPDAPEDFYSLRDRIMTSLLYTTGMRRAEIISLRDADADIISMQLKVTGKRNKQRIIPFGKDTADEISAYLTPVSYTHLTLPTIEPYCRSRWWRGR